MRLFIALNLPAGERRRIHSAVKPLREEELPVRWVSYENYHITLKFLGDVHPDRAPRIEDALAEVASKTQRFSLNLGGFGAFPTIRRPRVIWMGVEATPALRCLKQDVEWALADCGFERETQAFHPHLTIGRADPEGGAGVFRGLDELAANLEFEGSVDMKTVDIMRSKLSKSGPSYSMVTKYKLQEAEEG